MSDDSRDELVQVAVPRQHLMAVYGLLASLDGEPTALVTATVTATEGREAAAGDAEDETWPVEDLRRFAATPTATSATIGKVLDVLVAHPGDYLSTSELVEQTGIARGNLKGAFSALTRHINKHYDGRGWMLTFKWGPQLGPGYPAEGHYAVSEEQAARWKEARAND